MTEKALFAIGLVVLVFFLITQAPRINLFSTNHTISIRQIQSTSLFDNPFEQTKKDFRQVSSSDITRPIKTTKEPIGFHIITTEGANYCCDSQCSYSCSGSYDYCNNWCDTIFPHEKLVCPDGYSLISGTDKCCPNSFPYYCSKNNLCYQESNCGQGVLGEVECRTHNIQSCTNGVCIVTGTESTLFRKEIVHSVTKIDSCISGTIIGCGLKYGGTTDQDCLCDVYSWNANNLASELDKQFFYSNGFCDSCSSKLCVRNNKCQLTEIKCTSATQYYPCKTITPNYFSGSFNDYTKTIENCPSGTICNVNRCEKDSDGDGFPDSLDQCPNNAPTDRVNKFGCPLICGQNEVKLVDGTCKRLIQTCIDNNLNNICDSDDPIVWADPTNNVPICADRNGDRVCDGVEGLFCKDSNSNKICDSDEIKWLATYCLDENGNGICDGIESKTISCLKEIAPICDLNTNITYPNKCFADSFNVINRADGSCKVQPIIIRRDCATGNVPIPSSYICDFETGWLFKREFIYQNITIDCRTSSKLDGYECIQVGENWVWTRKELINIDCYSRGCPKSSQLCQGGICVESQKRCPEEIDCKAVYGDSTCDEEIGLCTKIQFKVVQPKKEGFFASIPLSVKIIGGILIGFLLLRAI